MLKKSSVIFFGAIVIFLGFNTTPQNFVSAEIKYIVGGVFIIYAIFFMDNNNKKEDL